MGVFSRKFINCSTCNFEYFIKSSSGGRYDWRESVYVGDNQEFFPLLSTKNWCNCCNTITNFEKIPSNLEIDSFVTDAQESVTNFESGKWDFIGGPKSAFLKKIISNQEHWRAWSKSRTFGRCLNCGATSQIIVGSDVLENISDCLPFSHPGCGGALLIKEDEEGIHFNRRRRDPEQPIDLVEYSIDGLPIEGFKNSLIDELREDYPHISDFLFKLIESQIKISFLGSKDKIFGVNDVDYEHRQIANEINNFISEVINCDVEMDKAGIQFAKKYPELYACIGRLVRGEVFKVKASISQTIQTDEIVSENRILMKNSLSINSFSVLGATVRDSRKRILELADEKSLEIDSEQIQSARSDLTNPRQRISAELSWFPGVSPKKTEQLLEQLQNSPANVRGDLGIPTLAHANLLSATFECLTELSSSELATQIIEFANVIEALDPQEILRDINDDRTVAGFPEVSSIEIISDELLERKRAYKSAVKDALNRMSPQHLVESITKVVHDVTWGGEIHAPEFIDDLIDSYQVESQGFLDAEAENIKKLIEAAKNSASTGEENVKPIVDKLIAVAKNWDKVAQPIQLSAKARGITHDQSKDVAYSIRGLSLNLFNEHDMLVQSKRLTDILVELFSEIPDLLERAEEDAKALVDIEESRLKNAEGDKEWERSITYNAEVGLVFKDELSISPKGIKWKDKYFSLDSITRVRWGGIRQSVNGIPTGTDYTIAFGDVRSEAVVSLRKESTYSAFTDKLWRAVCVRLMTDYLKLFKQGKETKFGEATVSDSGIVLIKRKLFGSNETSLHSWGDVQIWNADGCLYIGSKNDKKFYVEMNFITVSNVHILDSIVRLAFKKPGLIKLSQLLE